MTDDDDLIKIARQIYLDLRRKGSIGIVDWQVYDHYDLSTIDLRKVIIKSNGHLRLRPPGILEAVKHRPKELEL